MISTVHYQGNNIVEINVGKKRIRHKNDFEMMNSWIDSKLIEDDAIQIQSRSMSDTTLSDIDFKYKIALVWTTLKNLKITI